MVSYLSQGLDKGSPIYKRNLHPSIVDTSTSKFEFSSLFRDLFGPPGSGSVFLMRIRIQPTKVNADPDPQHCAQRIPCLFLSLPAFRKHWCS